MFASAVQQTTRYSENSRKLDRLAIPHQPRSIADGLLPMPYRVNAANRRQTMLHDNMAIRARDIGQSEKVNHNTERMFEETGGTRVYSEQLFDSPSLAPSEPSYRTKISSRISFRTLYVAIGKPCRGDKERIQYRSEPGLCPWEPSCKKRLEKEPAEYEECEYAGATVSDGERSGLLLTLNCSATWK